MNDQLARYRFFSSVAWLMGLMLAPHSLALLGNLAGENGLMLLVWLAAGVSIFIVNGVSYRNLLVHGTGPAVETASYQKAFGALPAILVPLGGRIVTALMAATGLLVTSGFVFNEVFVYWFPNFAFAFILLGALLAIQLFGNRTAEKFQVFFTGTAFAGLLLLAVIGLFGAPASDPGNSGFPQTTQVRSVMGILWLFVGFELLYLNNRDSSRASGSGFRYMVWGLLGAAILFGLWTLVSLKYVPAERLAETTIAHILTARSILGQPGRVIIGIVAIAGTCSAVNALFVAVSRMMRQMAAQSLLPLPGGLLTKRPAVPAIVLGVITALMMAGGMAGTEAIDIYLRAGLVFWMLNYAAIHLTVIVLKHRKSSLSSHPDLPPDNLLLPVAGAAVMFGSACLLIVTEPEMAPMLRFMALSLSTLFVLALGALNIGRRSKRSLQKVRIETEARADKS